MLTTNRNRLVSAEISGNEWRCPVVIVFTDAFKTPTPNNPTGFNTDLDNLSFQLVNSDIMFTIYKSWETESDD
jgi:hypothetical protein